MRKKIAKILASVMMVSALFTAVGCSSNNEPNEPNNEPNNTVENNNEENNETAVEEEENLAGQTIIDEVTLSEVTLASNPDALPTSAADREDTLIVGITNPDGRFLPTYSSSVYDAYIVDLIFGDGLIVGDGLGNTELGAITESYEISEDNLTYTFKIKEGLKYSNGNEIKAGDIALTYHIIGDPNYDGTRTSTITNWVGFEEYRDGDADSISGIEVIDDYTISFTLKEVSAKALWDFIYPPIDPEVYAFEKGDIDFLKSKFTEAEGAGPYIMTDYVPGSHVEFVSNPNYYLGEAKVENLIVKTVTGETRLQELITGSIDATEISSKPQDYNMAVDAEFIDVTVYQDNGYGYIGWDLTDPRFEEKEVRQALTYGLDREGFVNAYYEGMGVVPNTHYPSVSPAYTDNVNEYEYNPELAKQMLDDAGWELNSDGIREKDGITMEITWSSYTDSAYIDALIPVLQESWRELGVIVTVEQVEFATLVEKVYTDREFDIYNMAWSLSTDPDPTGIFGEEQMATGGNNAVMWDNEKSFELMEAGLRETDEEARMDIYREWAELVNEELPYLFVSAGTRSWGVSSRIDNMHIGTFNNWVKDIHLVEISN